MPPTQTVNGNCESRQWQQSWLWEMTVEAIRLKANSENYYSEDDSVSYYSEYYSEKDTAKDDSGSCTVTVFAKTNKGGDVKRKKQKTKTETET